MYITYMCMYIYIYNIRVDVAMYVSMYVCMYVCMYVRMYIIYIYIYICIFIYTHPLETKHMSYVYIPADFDVCTSHDTSTEGTNHRNSRKH